MGNPSEKADLSSPQRTEIKRRRLSAAASASTAADASASISGASRSTSDSGDEADGAYGRPPPRAEEDPTATWIGNHIRSLSDGPLPHSGDFGILLGHRIVKRFYADEDDKSDLGTLFLGTVVAYRPPGQDDEAVKIWDGGGGAPGTSTAAASDLAETAAAGLVAPGVYRVLFDDGDQDDTAPDDLYRCALEYHVQRQRRLKGSSKIDPVVGKDLVNGVPMARKDPTEVAGDRELRRHANPPLTRGRAQVLEMERLGFWLAHEAYHKKEEVPRPGPYLGSRGFVCWSEMEEDGADGIPVGVTHSEIGSTSSIKKKRGQQHTIERREASTTSVAAFSSAAFVSAAPSAMVEKDEDSTAVPQEKKKRRGRPPKKKPVVKDVAASASAAFVSAAPSAMVEKDEDSTAVPQEKKKRRGRPAKEKPVVKDEKERAEERHVGSRETESRLAELFAEDCGQHKGKRPRLIADAEPLSNDDEPTAQLQSSAASSASAAEERDQNAGQPTTGEASRPGAPSSGCPSRRRDSQPVVTCIPSPGPVHGLSVPPDTDSSEESNVLDAGSARSSKGAARDSPTSRGPPRVASKLKLRSRSAKQAATSRIHWSEEEDSLIRKAILDAPNIHGAIMRAFRSLAEGPLSHRSRPVIAQRWYTVLKAGCEKELAARNNSSPNRTKTPLRTQAKVAAPSLSFGSKLPSLKWTDEEVEALVGTVEAVRRSGGKKEDAFDTLVKGALSHRSLSSIKGRWYTITRNENGNGTGTGSQPKRQKKGRKKTTSDSSPCSSDEEENPHGDLTIGLPKSSDGWIYPESEDILLTHPAAVHHGETVKKMTIPSHQRLLRVPNYRTGADPHTFVLSVSRSTIPNSGRGLYLTYRGPDAQWKVPDYIDLGRYGPHKASDIKEDFLMEVKNFVYRDRPSEWCFDAPAPRKTNGANADQEDSEELEAQGLTIHGKKIIRDMLFDITDDATGEVHAMAEKTLLPFVNEVTVQGKRSSQKLKQVQNIDATHHDDGTLHYMIRSGSRFKRGETTELFVYYGAQYDHCRHRKPAEYSDNTEGRSPVDMVKGRAADSDIDDISTLTNPPSQDNSIIVPITAAGHNIHQSVCPHCSEHSTKVAVKTTACLSQYANMCRSIFTYTERDVIAILDLFIESPPVESVPRQRMWWMIAQIRAYLIQILYQKVGGRMPPGVKERLDRALDLFPRGQNDPHHDGDMRAMNKYKYMGVAIRKERGHTGFKTGMVEQIVTPGPGDRPGESDGDDEGEDDRIPERYLVVFYSGEGDEIVTENEIVAGAMPITYGMMG